MLIAQAFSLNPRAKICRFYDICKYFYKFFSSFLQINIYVFVFQVVANIERKKKIQALTSPIYIAMLLYSYIRLRFYVVAISFYLFALL